MARVGHLPRRHLAAALTLACLLGGRSSLGQVGDARDALPGIIHVPVAGTVDRAASLSASAGYGYTEGVLGRGDSHDRVVGTLAGSLRPTPWLAFALRFDGRYEHDVDPTGASTNGYVGDPRLFARVGTDLAGGLRIGAQLGVWLPGDRPPSLILKATTLDLVALATYAPAGSRLALTAEAGARWDNSAASDPDAAQLSDTARLGLGINDASGVLSGLGLSYRIGSRLELLGDVSADWLVGSSAPTALESPIIASLGARWDANDRGTVSLQVLLDASPSQRPDLAAPHPLVDVEPRIGATIGIVFRSGAPVQRPAPEPTPPDEPPPPPRTIVPAPTSTSFRGRVTGATGAPLAHAQVRLVPQGAEPLAVESDDDGRFELPDVPFGAATLEVQARGYATTRRDVTVDPASALVAVALEPAIPPAQIRGLVRDFAGKPVAATVVIEPIGVTAAVRPDGGFEIEVKPGAYDVVITAKGYSPQRRKVTVEPQGVTLLNVDLRGVR
jgi:hypothetical protein